MQAAAGSGLKVRAPRVSHSKQLRLRLASGVGPARVPFSSEPSKLWPDHGCLLWLSLTQSLWERTLGVLQGSSPKVSLSPRCRTHPSSEWPLKRKALSLGMWQALGLESLNSCCLPKNSVGAESCALLADPSSHWPVHQHVSLR